ncbi:MAG: DUF3333 domain-containing protein, partial [Paracoccaceae bacterium]|nr:DUF3333 domain-containing protein [Paracoccaceae bacterium]
MTDTTSANAPASAPAHPASSLLVQTSLMKKRNAAEARFRAYGVAAICVSLSVLAIMLWTIFSDGVSAFKQATFSFPVALDAETLDPRGNRDRAEMMRVTTIGYTKILNAQLIAYLAERGISTEGVDDKEIAAFISRDTPARLRDMVLENPDLLGQTIRFEGFATGRIDGYIKGRVTRETAERDTNISVAQLDLADRMMAEGILISKFNWSFLTAPDASDQRPEAAGLGVALIGSAYMMILVVIMVLPLGVAASIYLE